MFSRVLLTSPRLGARRPSLQTSEARRFSRLPARTQPPARERGTQPPLTHLPPPIVTNGSGPTQPTVETGAGAGAGATGCGAAGAVHVIPGGSHPPLQQVPPPSAANGFGVEHVDVVGAGAGVDAGVGAGVGADVGVAHDIPGGSQPPLQQTPPPSAPKGSGVVQLEVGAGDGAGAGSGGGGGGGSGEEGGSGAGVLAREVTVTMICFVAVRPPLSEAEAVTTCDPTDNARAKLPPVPICPSMLDIHTKRLLMLPSSPSLAAPANVTDVPCVKVVFVAGAVIVTLGAVLLLPPTPGYSASMPARSSESSVRGPVEHHCMVWYIVAPVRSLCPRPNA